MAEQFPCPNPTCPHVFSISELQSGGPVSCPRCGFRMQGKGAAPTPVAARPAQPVARPAVPVPPPVAPVALPVTASAPLAAPVMPAPLSGMPVIDVDLVASPPPAAPPRAVVAGKPAVASSAPVIASPIAGSPLARAAGVSPGLPTSRRSDGMRAVNRVLIVLGVLGVSACLVSGVTVFVLVQFGFFTFEELYRGEVLRKDGPRSSDYSPINGKIRTLKGTEEQAFELRLLRGNWDPDREIKTTLGATGAWRSKDDLWLAVLVKDYGTQKPRDAELLQQGIEKLEARFGESLELGAKPEPTDFAGERAQRLAFKGQVGVVISWGECTMFSHHGFGYWVFVGGPSLDEVHEYDAELKKEKSGFALVTERKGWREQPPKMETFNSSDRLISVTAQEGVWEKSEPANAEFETGTLLLFGRYLKENDNTKNAHLQVFTVEQQADLKEAMKQAREFLEKHRKEQNSGYKLDLVPDSGQTEAGAVEDIGNRKGRVAELMLSLNDSPMRYYLVAVTSEPEQTTVVLCDCIWKSRQIWRQDFLDLFKTFKAKPKG